MRTEMTEIEYNFKAKYPLLFDFMETTLWPDVDGFNPVELLHRFAYFGNPDRIDKMILELASLYSDQETENAEIAALFNREEIGHPYEVVTKENAKDFCFSMHESLRFVAGLRK